MLKKEITYTNFNGEEETEVFYFNMTRAELIELEYSIEGGFGDTMTKMIEADPEGKVNGKVIMTEMKKLILGAYGMKSADGKRFIKNDELRLLFESSEAYSVLFMELVTDADAAANFINGIMPQDLVEETQKALSQNGDGAGQTPMGGVRPAEEQVQPRVITRAEAVNMPSAELMAGLESGAIKVDQSS